MIIRKRKLKLNTFVLHFPNVTMKNYLLLYINNFKGFTREIWVLTLITFINRAGAMVMPFLTQFLYKNFYFSLNEVGWMLACIGCGSFVGSYIGGRLTDKFGFYMVMLCSLFLTGFGFICLLFLYQFEEFCIGLFLLTAVADMYKPAMYVAVGNFTHRLNRTRALSLIRLSINLGIVTGPIIGGFLAATKNYDNLFWIDGLTCLIAIILFMLLIDETKILLKYKGSKTTKAKTIGLALPLQDLNFNLFLLASFVTAFLFFQLFSTIPLYNSNALKLSENQIGILLSLNGLVVFLFEMPIIAFLEKRKIQLTQIIFLGSFFMAAGFLSLLLSAFLGFVILSIILITFGQILTFSFANTFAFRRAKQGYEGQYMAFYSMSFSLAQIISPKISLHIIEQFNYFSNWILMLFVGIFGIGLYYFLHQKISNEKRQDFDLITT